MAQSEPPPPELSSSNADGRIPHKFWRKLLGRNNVPSDPAPEPPKPQDPSADDEIRPELIRRVPREVVPGLPRAKTFKRQQSELRENLEPVQPTPAERRALSMDRRWHASQTSSQCPSNPRTSAPDMVDRSISETSSVPSLPASPVEGRMLDSVDEMASLSEIQMQVPATEYRPLSPTNPPSLPDDASMTTSQYDQMIHDELEQRWILNLSMHFRDRTKREKFFVTFRQDNAHWRRVTISLDYRNAPEDSLEMDLFHTKHQRDKNAKIYEAIRESLEDIQFYETVTNLKLQTTDGRLHVHVVEDVNEVIEHPNVNMVKHLGCPRIREKDIEFDSHMSGFVYKVRVDGRLLIKKEIPGQDTVDEFLYEVNALHHLRDSPNVIEFFGVVVDDKEEKIKGLLISYADQGALIDIIYDHDHTLPWVTREKWARQVVQGLSHIHEAGFVQGDFTLSNIVIDSDENARIIDINRRGCPVGWEPPEATPLIDTGQRISMYIGVKSDLFQLGMVLWALAAQEDEPESSGRPLTFDEDLRQTTPEWYQRIVQICLSPDPRRRVHATDLLRLFPVYPTKTEGHGVADKKNGHIIRTGQPPSSWQFDPHYYVNPDLGDQTYAYPPRGRSPPSPLPSNHDGDRPYWSRGYSYGGGHSTSASSVPESMPQEYAPSEKASKFGESREISVDAVVHEAGMTGPQGKAFLEHNDETPRVEKEGLDIGSAGGDAAPPPESAHASSEEERPAEQWGSNDAKEKMIVPEVRVDTAPSDLSESHVDEDEVKPTSSPRAASWHIEDQQRDTVSSTGAEPGSTGPGPSEDDGDEKIQDQSERWEEAHPQEHAGDIQMKHSASSDKDGSSSRSKLDKVTTDTLFESSDPPPVGPGSEAACRSPAAATGGTVAEDLQGIGSAHESSAGGDESPTTHETMEHDLGLLTTTHQPTDHEAT